MVSSKNSNIFYLFLAQFTQVDGINVLLQVCWWSFHSKYFIVDLFFFFKQSFVSFFFVSRRHNLVVTEKKRFNQKHPVGISSPTKRPLPSSTLSMSSTAGRHSTAGRCMAQCSPSPLCDLECCRTTRYPVFFISAKVNKVHLKTPVTRSLHTECTSMVTQTLCVHCSSDNVC